MCKTTKRSTRNIGFDSVIKRVAVASADNGIVFTDTARLDAIAGLLKDCGYTIMHNGRLAKIYASPRFCAEMPVVVISTHADSVPKHHFARKSGLNWHGTFDNSITNAVAVWLMLNGKLKANVLIAFTGDEEKHSRGVDEVADFMKTHGYDFRHAIVTDVTEEGWKETKSFTVEDIFPSDETYQKQFSDKMRKALWQIDPDPLVIPDAAPDESWQYDEHGIVCFSLCIPCRGEMHDDTGLFIRGKSIPEYAAALQIVSDVLSE